MAFTILDFFQIFHVKISIITVIFYMDCQTLLLTTSPFNFLLDIYTPRILKICWSYFVNQNKFWQTCSRVNKNKTTMIYSKDQKPFLVYFMMLGLGFSFSSLSFQCLSQILTHTCTHTLIHEQL